MKAQELVEILSCSSLGNLTQEFTGLSIDSRTTQKGDLFFALPGTNFNGDLFIATAIKKGSQVVICSPQTKMSLEKNCTYLFVSSLRQALAKVASHFYQNPMEKLNLVGITGTNGKTTTSYLLKAILEEAFRPTGVIGTIGYDLGENTYSAKNTTPDSLTIHQLAQEAVSKNLSELVLEVSSHALCQERVAGVPFDRTIFTNLSGDHLDYHKTMEHYLESKSLLFKSLDPSKMAILNRDDLAFEKMRQSTSATICSYGIQNKKADFRAEKIQLGLNKTRFLCKAPSFSIPMETSLIGLHNIYNCLGAIACAYSMGVHPGFIQSALKKIQGVPGRLESIQNSLGIHIYVDYAHTDDALENILSYLHSLKKKKIITIFGCGGNRDRTKRPRMGKVASKWSDFVVVTSDNPREENPLQIIEEVIQGMSGDHYKKIIHRKEAIQYAISIAKKGDILLIAGKGHETYQETNRSRIWFDDRVIAKKLCEERVA